MYWWVEIGIRVLLLGSIVYWKMVDDIYWRVVISLIFKDDFVFICVFDFFFVDGIIFVVIGNFKFIEEVGKRFVLEIRNGF